MKKFFFISTLVLSFMAGPSAMAQSSLTDILSKAAQAAVNSSDTKSAGNNAVSSLVNSAVGIAGESTTSDLLSNLLSSVTGSTTTTKSNLVGNWVYTKPSVQFESESYLTLAGGTAIASKIEDKLATCYKTVGIKPDKLSFNFANDGKLTYGVGSVTRSGTYTFNEQGKTIIITTNTGASIKAYVTVSGDEMMLTFDAQKMITLMKTLGSRFNSIKKVSSIVGMYEGIKVGFTFSRK